MRKPILLLWFFLSSNIFAAKVSEPAVDENIKPLRIAFFIDDLEEKYCENGSIAITFEFTSALSQKALDIIIVSNYVLKNMILRKYTKESDKILTRINLDLNDWDIYQIEATQFFVFVPRGYDNPILNKTLKLDGKSIWTKIDFSTLNEYNGDVKNKSKPVITWKDLAPNEAIKLLSHENLKYIPYAKDLKSGIENAKSADANIHKKFLPNQLPWILKPIEDYNELSLSQPCNIYINGHGGYSQILWIEKSVIAGMSSEDMVNTLLFFNDKLNTKSVRISTCSAGGRNLDLMRIKNNIPIRIKYLLLVDSITDAPTGLTLKQERNYFFFDIKGYFEALENFQGEYNSFVEKLNAIKAKKRILPAEAEKEIKSEIEELEKSSGFNGILKELSLLEDWYFDFSGPNSFPQIWIPEVGWFQTFNTVKITDASIIKALAAPEFIKNEEVEIEDVRENPPKVKKVRIKSRLKKMDFAESGTLEIKGTLALPLYSEIVFTNINIISGCVSMFSDKLIKLHPWLSNLYKYFPSIPCLDSLYTGVNIKKDFYIYPQIISMQHGDSLNLFAKISLPPVGNPTPQNGILNFLRDSFLILRERESKKIFFIKELEGYNDFSVILRKNDKFREGLGDEATVPQQINMQNVFIETFGYDDGTHINISFEFNKKAWVLSYSAKDLNPKNPVLANKAQSLWNFKKSKSGGDHEQNLNRLGLTYLAKLTLADYCAQLLIIRDLFKRQTIKTFKKFMIDLKPEDIIAVMKESPIITKAKWIELEQPQNQLALQEKLRARTQLELGLEQQFRLQMNLKRLKTLLNKHKQKLELLGSKLGLLKIRLDAH